MNNDFLETYPKKTYVHVSNVKSTVISINNIILKLE